MIKALIIDDEPNAREILGSLLGAYCPEVEVVGMAGTVSDGFMMVQQLKPQLLFLDIEMKGETGFDLIDRFQNPPFKIIFVTSYDHYALKAIKFSALDYLLKPVKDVELVNAVLKAKAYVQSQTSLDNLQNLITTLKNPLDRKNKIAISTQIGIEMVEIDTIVRCEASGSYTTLYLIDQRRIVSSRDLKSYQELLEDYNFFRVHDSHLIAYYHIHKVLNEDGGVVLTSSNERIPISRRRKSDFQDWLKDAN
jgi:two-component system, LytTR family, response regulator